MFVTHVNVMSIDMKAGLTANCSTNKGQSGVVIVSTETQAFGTLFPIPVKLMQALFIPLQALAHDMQQQP